jgi:predicted Zn-dependent peptidase
MKLKFYRKVLKNGMTLIFEKRDLPVASVVIAVRAGGINEKPSEKGISHFIEHMLYKGTPTRNSRKIAEEIEKNGGELNGFTDEIITAFWCKIPSSHLKLALEVLTDMVKNPLFDAQELEKERKVIFEEIKMRKDNPHTYVFDSVQNELYSGTLGLNLIGDYKTMGAINREKMVKKFEEIYQPNNMILGIVGDANFEDIVRLAEENFGNKKGHIPKVSFSLKNNSKIETRKGIDQANLIFAYHVPTSTNKQSYTALVLNTLMAGGMSSRLFQEVREKRNLAYAVKGDSNINKDFAYNTIYVGAKKENVSKIRGLILKEFKEVSESLTEKELNQVKVQLVGNYHIYMEDSQSQLINLLIHELDGNAKEFYDFEKNIKSVRLEDVKKMAKIKDYSFFALVPEK